MSLLDWIIVTGLAVAPISEQRGAIIYGVAAGLNPYLVFLVSIALNIVPILLLFYLFRVSRFREKILSLFGQRAQKQIDKNHKLELYKELALFSFVAIPMPFTGAYTGALITEILGWNKKKAFYAISVGVIASGIIVLLSTLGIITLFRL